MGRKQKQYYCSHCKKLLDAVNFTKFARNPSLSDREGRVVICKNCCSMLIEQNGNDKNALKEILRLIDIPYLERYADSALDNYSSKMKNTHVVIKQNAFDNSVSTSIETNNLGTSLYTCYTAFAGILPKGYINYSFSDGVRNDDELRMLENIKRDNSKDIEEIDSKEVTSAKRHLQKLYGKEIYADMNKLHTAIQLTLNEIALNTHDANKRQKKFRLKVAVNTLVENEILDKKFSLLFDDKENALTDNIMEIKVDENDVKNDYDDEENFNFKELKNKWGMDFTKKDLIKFEKKYTEMRKIYGEDANEEFLRHACIASVRATECMATNDVDGAKTWMQIFKDITVQGKLAPASLKDSDLNNGIASICDLVKMMEQEVGIISVLPEFKKFPKDDADMVIYCNVQYMRRIKGLPDIKYEDIWDFYEDIAKSFIDEGDEADEMLKDILGNNEDKEGDADD